MDLTLDSFALSVGGWVGHLAYFLLVLSMLMRRLVALRVLAIASALVGVTYDYVWLQDPIGVFWESLLLAVNLGQLGLIHLENHRATFSTEDRSMLDRIVPNLDSRLQRRLLDVGVWGEGDPGLVLTREGESVNELVYLASGEVLITLGGVGVAACHEGAFVGEMTVLTQDPATGTAVLSQPTRYWAVDARVLRQLGRAEPEILSALRASFARNMREKLVASNQAALAALQDRR